jgi:hypothetical protein
VARDGPRLADDLATGVISAPRVRAIVPQATLSELEAQLGGPNPRRAEQVRAALRLDAADVRGADGAVESRGLARRLWPQLRLFLANGTGAFASYASGLQAGEGHGVPILSTVLAASEGLIGVSLTPTADGHASYCLVPRALFYEFIPVSERALPPGSEPHHYHADAQRAPPPPAAHAAAADSSTPASSAYGGTLLSHELRTGDECVHVMR